MKKLGANLFLFSILMGLMILPMSSMKLVRQETPEVLSVQDIEEKYLEQRIAEQEKEIEELKSKLEEVNETTQSAQDLTQ